MNPHNPQLSSLITQHLDTWTSAIKAKASAGRGGGKKQEFYGIKKLRELILELAVRGLLVPQDPKDEPAVELLRKISVERSSLIQAGKLKKQQPSSSIKDENSQYPIPKGWVWTRIGTIGNVFNGNSISSRVKEEKYTGIEGYPFIATKDVGYGFEGLDYENGVAIPVDEDKFQVARKGSVLICAEGGSAGKKCGITDRDICFGNKLFANELIGGISSKYILSVYLSPTFFSAFSESMTGIIGGISKSKFETLLCPLPPLAEQHRIVAKVDELMALCDQLEQQQEDSVRTHGTLVQTLLGTLTAASEPGQLAQAWQRIAAHFDPLFTTESSIDQLKQTILQLAVMGKLVEQDPEDEKASELLKKIATEKAKLIKTGKIKKQKTPPPVSDDEMPFEKPYGWEFCRLKECAYVFSGNAFKSEDFNNTNGIRVIKITNAGVGELIETEEFLPPSFGAGYENFQVIKGDMILALTRPYISTGLKVSICSAKYDNALLNQRVAAIRCFIDTSFMYQYMQSTYVLGLYQKRFSGSGLQPNLKMADVTELITPVPPLAEQRRIVARVSELMTLCDHLKANLQAAQTTQLQLADNVVEAAIR